MALEAIGRMSESTKGRRKARRAGAMGLAEMRKGYDEAKGYWRPQYDYGQNALRDFQAWGQDPNAITSDPSYQWRVAQGQEGIENSAAARGGALSGNALRAIEDYRQGAASQEYGNEFNRWLQKLGLGREATNAMAGLSERGGLGLGQTIAGIGQQDFQNRMAVNQQARQDVQTQNEIIGDWYDRIMGGGGGMGGMGGGG